LNEENFDVVVIASPNHTHEEIAIEAIASGKHVLVEKPLATTVEGCLRIEEEALKRPSQVVAVGLEYRFMAPTSWLLDKVRVGVLGDVRLVSIIEHRFPFLDKVGSWNRFNENTGGTFVEKCCHFFDLMYQVFRSEPVAVMASAAEMVNHRDESYGGRRPDILDNGYVIVEFEGNKRAMLELCMFAEGSRDEQIISVVGDAAKAEIRIPSQECSIGVRSAGRAGVVTQVIGSTAPYQGLHHGSSFTEHVEFRKAIFGDDHHLATLRDGTRSVAMGVAAQRSIAEQRRVTLSEVGYVA
jgi:predicted dehydrogenase